MKLGTTQKPKVHLGGLSSKQAAFLGMAGLVLVGGLVLRSIYLSDGEDSAPVATEASQTDTAPVPALAATEDRLTDTVPGTPEAAALPAQPAEQPGDTAQQTGDELPNADMILVARRPVELLAEPSADATVMFGFPAGRPFRVIGEKNGFVEIRDEKSGANGWIDKTALAAPPPRAPVVTRRSSPGSAAGGRRTSPRKPDTAIVDELQTAVEPPKQRPGLFGGGGILGGLFRN